MVTSPEDFRQQLLDIQNSVDVVYTTLPSDEPRFIIDANSRTITIPLEFQFLGVKNDHNAETVYFEIDRYFDDEDLSQHTCVVQFSNKNNSNDGGVYPVTTMDTTSVDGKIIFGWEIKSDATSTIGDIYFSVRFYSIDSTDYIFTYNFNTLTAKSVILDTLDVDNQMIIENYPSELDAWTAKMDELSRGTEGKVEEVQQVSAEAIAEINAVKESIPEDYNTLSNDVNGLKRDLTMLKAQACIFENESQILGLQVDYKNKTQTRIAGAKNLNAGADFDGFSMFGGRRRCNVADDGTIVAYYGDADYKEDGSMGQVMVYQPKFYYMVAPLEYDAQSTGYGYHLRKANYYVTDKPRTGFKLHPAFYDANGNELDYILIGAYEGSIYDTSASAYLLLDEQVMTVGEDKFCSIAGVKPASGLTQNLTRPNIETMAQNRGANWHLENSKIVSMEQLLCMIEMGTMNFQTAIGQGVVSISDNSSYNCASLTGSTARLGNGTGRATETINEKGGVQTTETADGKTSVSYRGVENDWGNIWKFIIDPNIWGNGAMGGGEPFYCDDFNFAENKKTDNYKGAGFTVTNASGYISAMGYSTACDWLFMASECLGNSSVPVGDYHWVTQNLNGYRIARLGGAWDSGSFAGGFCWTLYNGVGGRDRGIGGRLVYVPTATA